MIDDRLAVWLDSYNLDEKAALRSASQHGFRSVHASALGGTLDPRALSQSGRRHLARYLRDLGLRIGGLAAEFPGDGLADPARAQERLERLSEFLSLARSLHVPVVTSRASGLVEPDTARGRLAREVLSATADLADRMGVRVAIEPAQGGLTECAKAVRALDCPTLTLAWDTGKLSPHDDLSAIASVAGSLWLRDVRAHDDGHPQQVAFGAGHVNFARVLAVSDEADYRGDLVIRTDRRRDAVELLLQGKRYFQRLTGTA